MPVTMTSIRFGLAQRDPITASPEGRRESAVALVLAPGSSGLELLLIRRAERTGDPWSGQMGLPGGRREPADADLMATAMRETYEEIGVDLRGAELLGQLDDLAPTIEHLPRMLVRPFVFAVPDKPILTLSDEVALTIWTDIHELPGTVVQEVVQVRERSRSVVGYRLGAHLVWGMTERILSIFIELAIAAT